MIDLYYWSTPNGEKILICLTEMGLEYHIKPINIGAGDQFGDEFIKISPNNKIPAIVDHAPDQGGEPISVFESGAILLYLAAKTKKFLPKGIREATEVREWLMWQMGGLGPMLGQNHYFRKYDKDQIEHAIDRYTKEAHRLYAVLNRRLEGREWICGDYSIADMACYPWTKGHHYQGVEFDNFPNVAQWQKRIEARPAVITANALDIQFGSEQENSLKNDETMHNIMFGQSDKHVK